MCLSKFPVEVLRLYYFLQILHEFLLQSIVGTWLKIFQTDDYSLAVESVVILILLSSCS